MEHAPGTDNGGDDAPSLDLSMDGGVSEGEDVSVGLEDGATSCDQSESRVAPPGRPKFPAVAWVGAWANFKPADQSGDDDDDYKDEKVEYGLRSTVRKDYASMNDGGPVRSNCSQRGQLSIKTQSLRRMHSHGHGQRGRWSH